MPVTSQNTPTETVQLPVPTPVQQPKKQPQQQPVVQQPQQVVPPQPARLSAIILPYTPPPQKMQRGNKRVVKFS